MEREIAGTAAGRRRPRGGADVAALPLAVVLLVAVWAVAAQRIAAPYLLPSPVAVARSMASNRALLAYHTEATLAEVCAGFALGFALAAVLGYVISHSLALERLLTPYIVASQAVPIVAVAPLLVLWFGPGMPVKVGAAALIVFFPMLINTVVGLRNIDPTYRDLMRSLSATRWQTLVKLELPAALPVLLGGLRVGVTLSVIGAVVGEFLGSSRGLGSLVQVASGQYNGPLTFAALLVLVALALGLYGAVSVLDHALLHDRR